MITAADVDEEETGHTQSPSQNHQHYHMTTTTQTKAGTSTGATALTLAGQSAPESAPLVKSFISKPGRRGSTGTGHKASLGGPGGPGGVLRYCRNVHPTWVKFDSKDTKESGWLFEVLSTKSKKRT